mgnify:CR=1 FL=1
MIDKWMKPLVIDPYIEKVPCTTQEPEEIFAQLYGSTVFSKIDLSNAFLQIPLTKEAQEFTTITTPFGLFRYKFLPFGLSVSPGIFQREINKLLNGLSGVLAYQDDLIIYSINNRLLN